MDKLFIPIRLREARKLSGLSLGQLVDKAKLQVTRQSIFNYERGVMQPKPTTVKIFADTFGVSELYFYGTSTTVDVPMLRSGSDGLLTEEELYELETRVCFLAERYMLTEEKADVMPEFYNPMSHITVSTLDDAIMAANRLREVWNCGFGPLPAVLRLIERKGIKIVSMPLPAGIWGLSTLIDGCHPLIVLDMHPLKTTVERLRFTACHELAHLLLRFSEGCNVEQMCNKFANFFLFPKQTFIEEMGALHRDSLVLEEMIDLKEAYGISIAAQVHAAWDIRMISREHYDWWFDERIKKNRREKGWGKYTFPETLGRENRLEARVKK